MDSENRKVLEEHEKQYQEMEHNQTTSATRLTEISSELEEVEEKLQEVHMSSFEDEKRRKRADILSALQNVTQGVVRYSVVSVYMLVQEIYYAF